MQRLQALLGPGDNRVVRAFDFMGWAEQEIAAGKARYPRAKDRIHRTFGILFSGELLSFGEALYREHCRELIARVAKREDTRPGTRAEVLACISTMTLTTRLQRDVEELALELTAAMLSEHEELAEGLSRYEAAERSEKLEEFRRKLTKSARWIT